MNKVNEHAHTHTRIQENENLKKGNGGSQSRFRSSTLLRQCSITNALFNAMIFRKVQCNDFQKSHDKTN